MGKPSKGTPADRRLKANAPSSSAKKAAPAAASASAKAPASAAPVFGSPAWRKKYGK